MHVSVLKPHFTFYFILFFLSGDCLFNTFRQGHGNYNIIYIIILCMYAHISILILIIIFFLPIVHRPYRVLIYPAPKTFLEKIIHFLKI